LCRGQNKDKNFAVLLAKALAAGAELPVNPKITACPHTSACHEARGRCTTCYGRFRRERKQEHKRKLAAASSTVEQHSGAEPSGSGNDSAGSQQQQQRRARRSSGEQASAVSAPALLACGAERPVNPKITACPHTTAAHSARGMCSMCYERWRTARKRERAAQSAAPDTAAAATAGDAATAATAAAAAAAAAAASSDDSDDIEIVSQSDPDDESTAAAAASNSSSSAPVVTCGHPEKPHKALGMCGYVHTVYTTYIGCTVVGVLRVHAVLT
jgi:hypothetical protein